jgi:DNA-binding protein HU-beta
MNKSELIERLSGKLGDAKTSGKAVDAVIGEIEQAVSSGEKVNITGFGVFEKRERAARTGRNPRTGEPIKVQKSTVPAFRPGTSFKTLVAGGGSGSSSSGGSSHRAPRAQSQSRTTSRAQPAARAQSSRGHAQAQSRSQSQPQARTGRSQSSYAQNRSQSSYAQNRNMGSPQASNVTVRRPSGRGRVQ